jgi:hypothetical protein
MIFIKWWCGEEEQSALSDLLLRDSEQRGRSRWWHVYIVMFADQFTTQPTRFYTWQGRSESVPNRKPPVPAPVVDYRRALVSSVHPGIMAARPTPEC